MHIEDTLRIAMEEKDDLINVLKTQVRELQIIIVLMSYLNIHVADTLF